MKIALVQIASPDGESRDERVRRVEGILRGISGADLIVLPEMWGVGYNHFDQYASLAETLDGPTVTMCSRVAKELGVYVHMGSVVLRRPGGELTNTSVLLNAQGEIVHEYSKIHVFGYKSLEAELLTAGDSMPVADSSFGKVAGITCYDLRFPGLWMEMSNRGVEVVIVPAAWPAVRREHWRLLTTARAVEHQIFVIACNAVGTHGGLEEGGHSRVVDPSGVVLAEAGTEEGVTMVEIDPEQVARVRKEFPVIADRLPDYTALGR